MEARPAVGEELAGTVDRLRVALLEHLDDEEAHILPLAARHVSQQEWNRLGEHGLAAMAMRRQGHHQGLRGPHLDVDLRGLAPPILGP